MELKIETLKAMFVQQNMKDGYVVLPNQFELKKKMMKTMKKKLNYNLNNNNLSIIHSKLNSPYHSAIPGLKEVSLVSATVFFH